MDKKPVVVIVGAGFGGLNAAKELHRAPVNLMMLNKNNYHLFQPLLYQVATAGLSPGDIAYPVRAVFRNQRNFHFYMTEVTGVDMEAGAVLTHAGPFAYDYLILAVGGETNFFGLESVARNGFELKDLDDAIGLRNHILKMFELSYYQEDPVECNALRTFVIVGGGPTGVECAGALSELIRMVLVKDFPNLDVNDVRVVILEALDQLLPGFPDSLRQDAVETLKTKHVDVQFNCTVTGYDGRQVTLKDGSSISAYTLIWAAGVQANSLSKELDIPTARQGRIVVEPTLQVPGRPNVYVIGDAAYLEEDGNPLPMVAPVAIQQGKLAAKNIMRHLAGKPLENFDYRDPGSLATIGRNAAVARIKRFKFTGFLAWLVWLAVHLFWLVGFRNRLAVLLNWANDYLFYERSIRLITPVEKTFADDKLPPFPPSVRRPS